MQVVDWNRTWCSAGEFLFRLVWVPPDTKDCGIMVQNSSDTIRHCLAKAEECEEKANSAIDAAAKAKLRELAERWRRLAENE